MNKQRIVTMIALVCTALILLVGGTFAWYYNSNKVNLNQIDGAVTYLTKYFESGDGKGPGYADYDDDGNIVSEEGCAYEIKTAVQFYNLAWLQYMGYFNQPEEETTTIPTTYFYLSADIDMTGYVLPPIGTSTNPFLGNFDGCGHTVTGLTVTNKVNGSGTSIKDLPYTLVMDDVNEVENVEIIGLFGVVGTLDEATTGSEEDAKCGSYTYSSITNEVKNLYISNLTVETQTNDSLIGVAAGYVNGTVENVGIIDSNIKIDGTVTALSYTSNLSDYSLVGYCTEAYRGQDNKVTVEGSLDDSGSGGSGGAGTEWGNSLSMGDLYTRISNIYTTVGSDNAPLSGYVTNETRTYDSGANTFARTLTWSNAIKQARTAWYNVGGSYYVDAGSSFSKYLYLRGYSGEIQETYNKTITSIKDGASTDKTEQTRSGTLCYFPINVSSADYSDVPATNTGYFISRGDSYYGDFRLNKFSMSTISNALTSGNTYAYTATDDDGNVTKDNLKVLTWNKDTSVFALIEDTFNDAGTGGVTGLVRYNDARQQLANTLKGQTTITGMEFYGANIRTDSNYLITAPIVSINGTTYYDYQMPESCIDFQVQSPGYISFFAGTVFSAGRNNYFFSLHQIFRDSNNNITDIKQIQKIYKVGNTYVYLFEGETATSEMTDANLVFDLDWIMNAPPTDLAIYYFEIPVNAGEYALGSCGSSSDYGSCALLYLDIGTNGNMGGDSGQTETTMFATAEQYIYPNGVDFLAGETGLNDIQNSAAITLPSGTSGDISFSRAGDTITVNPTTNLTASYIKEGITVTDIQATSTKTETVYLKKVSTTTLGVTTARITKGSSAGDENDLVLEYTYTAADATITTAIDMPDGGSTWELVIMSNVDINVTEVGTSGFDVTINGESVSEPGTITGG